MLPRSTLARRLVGARVVVDVRLSAVLLVDIAVRDVNVVDGSVVVIMVVCGKQMPPVLAAM
jgi:hypothetical protein